MQSRFLFPHHYQRIGWFIFLPSLALGLACMYGDFRFDFLDFDLGIQGNLFDSGTLNFTDEIASIGLIVSLLFIAFSKEKVEDERIAQLRLESLQFAVYLNYAILGLQILVVHSSAFFEIMVYNMFSVLILFIIRFRAMIYSDNQAY
jgi:hypothetical protein